MHASNAAYSTASQPPRFLPNAHRDNKLRRDGLHVVTMKPPADSPARLVAALFFASGAAALVYEVSWTRMLALTMGTTVHAVATVLAAFFVGLALGSALFGRLADHVRRPLLWFAWMEAGIGLYALATPSLFAATSTLYVAAARGLDVRSRLPVSFAMAFTILLVPTTLMGGTYPMLLRGLVRGGRHLGERASLLYGANTAGAVCGTLLAGFVLLVYLGMSTTLRLAALVNGVVALGAYTLSRARGRREPGETHDRPLSTPGGEDSAAEVRASRRDVPPSLAPLLLACSALAGCCALACEVLWTRSLTFFLGHTVYAFSTMLATFLFGLSLGGLAASAFAARLRRPLLALGLIEIVAGALLAGSTWLFARIPTLVRFVFAHTDNVFANLTAKFLACGAVMLPTTLAMGMAFPLFVALYARARGGTRAVGRSSGHLLAANTLGGVVGSLLAGFFLIEWIGVRGGLAAVGAGNAVVAAAMFLAAPDASRRLRLLACSAAAAVAAAPWLVAPPGEPLVTLVEASDRVWLLSYEEDATAAISVLQDGERRQLLVNATVTSTSDRQFRPPPHDLVNGHLPMLIRPAARSALLIGLGSGITFGMLGRYPLADLASVEICPAVVRASRHFDDLNFRILDDPRARVVINDARNHLLVDPARYDIIVNEAWFSMVTGATPLISEEFYRLVRSRLSDDGVFCPGPGLLDRDFKAEMRTLVRVFENVYLFGFPDTGCFFAVATQRPLRIEPDALAPFFEEPRTARALALLHIYAPEDLVASYICGPAGVRTWAGPGRVNSDDNPFASLDYAGTLGLGLDFFEPYRNRTAPAEIRRLLACAEDPMTIVQGAPPAEFAARVRRRRKALLRMLDGPLRAETLAQRISGFREVLEEDPGNPYAQYFLQDLLRIYVGGDNPRAFADRPALRLASPAGSLEGNAFDEYSDGVDQGGVWALYNNGFMRKALFYPRGFSGRLTIEARGDPAQGLGPRLHALVDREILATFQVDGPEFRGYDVPVTLGAGRHELELAFDNDLYVSGVEDRNLYVRRVTFAGEEQPPHSAPFTSSSRTTTNAGTLPPRSRPLLAQRSLRQ